MSIFDRHKVKLVLAKIDVIKDTAEREGRFSLFHTIYAEQLFNKNMSYAACEKFFDIVESNDEDCKLPYNVGEALDRYAQNNRVFLHRVNLYLDKNKEGIPDSKDLYSMMVDGLENHGHANAVGGSAFSDVVPSLNLTMSPLEGFTGYVNLVNSHKGNDAIILASFPDDYFNKDGSELDSQGNPVVIKKSDLKDNPNLSRIYNYDGHVVHVKPEFMTGAIIKRDNGLWDYYSKDQIINNMKKMETEENRRGVL